MSLKKLSSLQVIETESSIIRIDLAVIFIPFPQRSCNHQKALIGITRIASKETRQVCSVITTNDYFNLCSMAYLINSALLVIFIFSSILDR